MTHPGSALEWPKGLTEVDANFMTAVLRNSGVITHSNEVVTLKESIEGITAGFFSSIKRVHCTYKDETDAPKFFIVKGWPASELIPSETIKGLFTKDVSGYQFPAAQFFPRPIAVLAGADPVNNRLALVMEDADTFAEHKVQERELDMYDVMRMVPKLVDVAVAWEGCHDGDLAEQLTKIGIDDWASDANLSIYKNLMPGGARIFDRLTTMATSSVIGPLTWDRYLGPNFCETFTRKIDAYFHDSKPQNGATCTLVHGDLKGDNIFFCEPNARYPHGWLCIDFQLMFRGPVPSDLAFLMGSGSVLPSVYTGENRNRILRSFYDQFMAKTKRYKDYTYIQFEREYAMMATVNFVYCTGMGASIFQAAAHRNQRALRVELGGKGATEADLSTQELRARMWLTKLMANCRENFKAFNQYQHLQSLPDNLEGLGAWVDLPDHLK